MLMSHFNGGRDPPAGVTQQRPNEPQWSLAAGATQAASTPLTIDLVKHSEGYFDGR